MNTQLSQIPVVQLADLALETASADCIRSRFNRGQRIFVVIGRYRKARRPGTELELMSVWSLQTDEDVARKAHDNWKAALESDLQLVEVASPAPQQTDPEALIVY
jgi:hypothetical protein